MGFDSREITPLLAKKIIVVAADARSYARAEKVMKEGAGCPVSAKTIERVVGDVGRELAERRDTDPRSDDALAHAPAEPPGEPLNEFTDELKRVLRC